MLNRIYRNIAQSLRTFSSKSEMDSHIIVHRHAAGRKLHKNARAVLDMIAKHSVIVTGISWLNPSTIAKKLEVCERTVIRAINRLESLGIGERKTIESNGMTFSYFVILPFHLSENSTEIDGNLSPVESDETLTGTSVEDVFCSGESIKTTELCNKEKEEDEIYNTNARVNEYSVFQYEIYEQAVENGFNENTAEKIADSCGDIRATYTDIQTAYKALIERMNNRNLPRIANIAPYYREVLTDAIGRNGVGCSSSESTTVALPTIDGKSFPFYNWLIGEDIA